jgi:peptidoglycan/xylan/chitin deacetylase (PgdA/CDA1 family)
MLHGRFMLVYSKLTPLSTLALAFLMLLTLAYCSSQSYAADHAVILQYHHFGEDTPPSTSVTVKQFKSHLEYINNNGFNVLPLGDVVGILKKGDELPENAVVITIDDAYTSIYKRAYPLLRGYGYPFTVFVSTEGVERGIRSYMTWEQMKEMQKNGASFDNHSHTHDYLIRTRKDENMSEWKSRVTNDIQTAAGLLKKNLNIDSNLFAYPYGEYNAALKEIINELKLTGIGQHSGPIWSGSDFAALSRFPMAGHFADIDQFITKVLSLPLPVISVDPADMALPEGVDKPVLSMQLAPGEYRPDSIACYASGQGRIKVLLRDREQLTLEVTAEQPLPPGRSRYNCTAAHKSENRFYWYSHPWIRMSY